MNSETAPLFFSLIALFFFINFVYDGCFLFSYSFAHSFHKYMLRTYCVLSTLGSTMGKAEGKILLYLALGNTEVISKANSRMGTVLAAVCRERPVNIAALTGEASVQLWACL